MSSTSLRRAVRSHSVSLLLVAIAAGCISETPGPIPSASDSTAAPAQPVESAPAPVESAEPDPKPLELSWTISTTEGTYIPESIIYLNAAGLRFPIASGPGMRDMTPQERERFRAPDKALAATGYGPGFRVNQIVMKEDGLIRIKEAIRDEGMPSETAYDYKELAAVRVHDIKTYTADPFYQADWSACFEGHQNGTTSTYEITVLGGNISTTVKMYIEDEQNAYFTVAQGSGGGTQIGSLLFVEIFLTIEDDNQNHVQIWSVDAEAPPTQLTVGQDVFKRCAE